MIFFLLSLPTEMLYEFERLYPDRQRLIQILQPFLPLGIALLLQGRELDMAWAQAT